MRKWLKEIRENEGLTQEQIAERSGIARATYGHIESGERGATVANAKKISAALGFHWTLFFEDENHDLKNEKEVG
ncbi:helix-turn-helix transcriptional regulator [Sporosarcina sp. FSL K6-5500]|uniref:helix-turn-helix transcriptional regulator n=1 Tax=Sporosarcina sp. FSL K6-5500 TaxID=2921558 RepID=UPI0030FD04D5